MHYLLFLRDIYEKKLTLKILILNIVTDRIKGYRYRFKTSWKKYFLVPQKKLLITSKAE